MVKRLIFYYRYLTTPYRLRRWLNLQTIFVFMAAAVFFIGLVLTTPSGKPAAQSADLKQTVQQKGSPTRLSTDMPNELNNAVLMEKVEKSAQNLTPTPADLNRKVPTLTPTLSAEYLNNANQTIGITLMGAVLVLIVVVGVLAFLPRHSNI